MPAIRGHFTITLGIPVVMSLPPFARRAHWFAPARNTAGMSFCRPDPNAGIPTRLGGDPGFSLRVVASMATGSTAADAHATLRAVRAVARAGAVLAFARVRDPVPNTAPPEDQGEAEFHWIMRDFSSAAVANLPPLRTRTRRGRP